MHMICINNQFLPANTPCIFADDRGFLLGDGLFETIKVKEGQFLYFEAHFERLQASAKVLAISFQYNKAEILMLCHQLLELNNLKSATAFLRITLTRGRSERGIAINNNKENTLLITCGALSFPTSPEPIKLNFSAVIRNELSLSVSLKTVQYLDNILAKELALREGFDDGLLFNTKGNITETSVANIFFIYKNGLITTRIEDGIIRGIMREVIIKIAKKNKIPLEECSISREELSKFEGAFICNSLIEIQGVAQIGESLLQPNHSLISKIRSFL